ncbi:MAG: aminotransferase class III-fold pyridoxal phosphate-dependent enzyme, partial [Alphaproteobacteria bacterium]|nr:aminotransferase class III-fold pyridoxal phosphate-dependent enzyme [Alphaproteobacteria bacterium]
MKASNFLKENNARNIWHPMGHPGKLQKDAPTIITGGDGVHITDIDGHRVVDGVGGLWNVNLGYSSDPVKQAITAQLDRLPYYSAFAGTSNDTAIELAFELREWLAEEGMGRAFFTSGGSDSVETALRLARQYHKLHGEPGRTKFLSLKKGYHGTHFGCASVNGNNRFRHAYEPLLAGCRHLPAPYPYRDPNGITDPARLAEAILATAGDEIAFEGADTIAAFIMEPILGAGGVHVPHPTLMPGMRDICDRHGILMIADEVITGFGRTGDWSGSRHWGVTPDMMCLAKAITNGYFPFGATMLSDAVAEVFETAGADGFIGHGYTYSAHPVGAAGALACLAETKRLKVKDNAKARGTQLYQGMLDLQTRHELIGDVRGGHGLMTAIELVTDRSTKAAVSPDVALTVQKHAYENGAMLRASGATIIISPPLVLPEKDAET